MAKLAQPRTAAEEARARRLQAGEDSQENTQGSISRSFADLHTLLKELETWPPTRKGFHLQRGVFVVQFLLTSKSMWRKNNQTKQGEVDVFLKTVPPPHTEPQAGPRP